jgi:hydrogenase-4 component F
VLHCAGRAALFKGGQEFTAVGGLLAGHRALGLTFAVGLAGLAGFSPVGVFSSAFLILATTAQRAPLLALPLALGLVVGVWALGARVIAVCFGPTTPDLGPPPSAAALALAWLHLALALLLGLAMPGAVAVWLHGIAGAIR